MHIIYSNKKLEEVFTDFGLMKRVLGNDLARTVKNRLNQLEAYDTFINFLNNGLGKPHFLEGDSKDLCGVSLTGNYRLIVSPVPKELSAEKLKVCYSVKIEGVKDYHGENKKWLIS